MAPTGQRLAHTPQYMQRSGRMTGAPDLGSSVIASEAQTLARRSAGKSGNAESEVSAGDRCMHGALKQRRQEAKAATPSAKVTVLGWPEWCWMATGAALPAIILPFPALLGWLSTIDIYDSFHCAEAWERNLFFG